MSNKYNQSKIYRIVSNVTGENYYGSTYEPTLAKRLAKHRSNYKDFQNGKGNFISSFKILETDDYDIILVENVNCNLKEELRQRERYFIENNECVNIVKRPIVTKNEAKQSKKEYQENNSEKRREYDIKYAQDNKEKIKQYKEEHYERNKDHIIEKSKQYYDSHKDKIKIRQSEIKVCECGAKYTHVHLQRHLRTKAHKEHQNNIQIKLLTPL